jgi:tRNA (cmo5U34)-methyltransferase
MAKKRPFILAGTGISSEIFLKNHLINKNHVILSQIILWSWPEMALYKEGERKTVKQREVRMESDKIASQFNSAASEYDKQRELFIPCFDDYYGIVQTFLEFNRPEVQTVLDLGAGTGLLAMYVKQVFPNASYVLVDLADQMLEIARKRFTGCENVKYEINDYSESLPESAFDLIISALSIHHLNESQKQSLYKNIFKKLNRNGCFINLDQFNAESEKLNEFYTKSWYERIKNKVGKSEENSWLARRELDKENTVSQTIEMLRESGFRDAECIYQYMKFAVIVAFR